MEDVLGKSWTLFYTKGVGKELDDCEPGDYVVEDILAHKVLKDGELRFLVRWEGYSQEHDTWEPPTSFLPRYCEPWAKYVGKKKLLVDVGTHLK